MSRAKESVTFSLAIAEKKELELLALKFGCTWGEKPNVSALLKAIAAKQLILHWNDEIPKAEISKALAKRAIAKIKQGLDELGDTF